jgi:hypothetical protein
VRDGEKATTEDSGLVEKGRASNKRTNRMPTFDPDQLVHQKTPFFGPISKRTTRLERKQAYMVKWIVNGSNRYLPKSTSKAQCSS